MGNSGLDKCCTRDEQKEIIKSLNDEYTTLVNNGMFGNKEVSFEQYINDLRNKVTRPKMRQASNGVLVN